VTGDDYDIFDHPDLLRAIRGLADYDNWVSQRLIPIALKWIDEHRDEVFQGLSEEDQDDMGAVIESAYRIIQRSPWMQERREASTTFNEDEATINPKWLRRTLATIHAEHDLRERHRKG